MQDSVTKPVDGIEGGMCSKCGTIKPIKEFERKLSLLQSRALGYAGNFPLVVTSKYCKACQPAQTPLRSMSKRRLAELVSQGVIPQVVADNAIKSKTKAGSDRQDYARMKRDVVKRNEAWGKLLSPLAEELRVVMQQGKFARMADDQFRIRYTDHYKKILVSVREEIKTRRDLKKEMPVMLQDWRQMVTMDEVRGLNDVWKDIPSRTRVKMRIGTLISAEWRQHIGATNVTPAMLEGRAASVRREMVMKELANAARERQAEKEKQEFAQREAESADETNEFLRTLGINPDK